MDLGPGQRFFWFTTTGWMMWNYLISGLLVGSTVVLFDGHPGYPDMGTLWRLAEKYRVAYFGISASYIQASMKAGLRPRDSFDLSALRAIALPGRRCRWKDSNGSAMRSVNTCRSARFREEPTSARRSSVQHQQCRCGWGKSRARHSGLLSPHMTRTVKKSSTRWASLS